MPACLPFHHRPIGVGDGDRTRCLNLGKVTLYQMSYTHKRLVDHFVATSKDVVLAQGVEPCISCVSDKCRNRLARQAWCPHEESNPASWA